MSLQGMESREIDRSIVFQFRQKTPQRLDKFLVACLPQYSRSYLQGLIKEGFVLVDRVPARKAGQLLEGEVEVEIRIPAVAPSELLPEAIPLDVLFENKDVLVVNKPAGMVVHPAAGHTSGTLVHAALAHVPDLEGVGGERRPGVVHRLDKHTSGVILLAKNDAAHRWLQEQFRMRRVEKSYIALVDGRPPTPFGRIEIPLGRNPAQRKQMAVAPQTKGREAISEYRTLETFPQHTLLEVHPLTGRTHQIRVHLSFLGCPVVGDTIYGRKRASLPLGRHFLHAASLKVVLPGESQPRSFEAPLPAELLQVLERLRAAQR